MQRDKLALVLAIGIPLLTFASLAWTFSHAVLRDLRITVVDSDRSPASLNYIHALSSSPGVAIDVRSGDLTEAMHAIRSGNALAAVFIPQNFEKDIQGLKRPQIAVFYNRQYFTSGNNASSSISNAIAAATAGLPSPAPPGRRSFSPGSLVLENYVLSNPALNFAQFLMRAVLPAVLHIVIAVAGGYAVGSEFASRNKRAWMRAAGGSPLAALVGKLAPFFGLFVLMMVIVAGIVDGVFHVQFRGSPFLLAAAACVLVIGYLSIGAFFQLLVRKLGLGLSLTGIVCSPAFGYAGVGFPVLAMNGFAQGWGSMLPLRWYIQILFDQAERGLPPADSIPPFATLGLLAITYFGFAWWRLSAISKAFDVRRPKPAEAPVPARAAGIGNAMLAEIRRILNDSTALGLLVLAPCIYGAFYPQPYLGQLLRNLPIAIVDQDHTEISRELIQAIDADEATQVVVRTDSLALAQDALAKRRVFGIIAIPEGSEREILKGSKARVAAYVDSAYFLMYSRILQGTTEAVQAVNQTITTRGARLDGSLAHAGLVRTQPVETISEPLYNPTGGYASYVVPAAFLLILQQTLLMGSSGIGVLAYQQGGAAGRRTRSGIRTVIGNGLAHLVLEIPALLLFIVLLPRVYGFSTLGSLLDLAAVAIPFVLSVSFLAQFVSTWFKRRESPVILFLALGMPLFFLVGVSWPREAIPDGLQAISRIFPSTSAIDAIVRINQMGATLGDVSREWATLWILAATYGSLAALAMWLLNRRDALHEH